MSLSNAAASVGIIAILLCCVGFLVAIFVFAPLPYLISAAILKIEKRGYWKAFGTAILGGLAGGVISAIIGFIFSAIAGGAGALTLNNINNLPIFLGALVGRLWLGTLISTIASILIQMLIASGLYGVSFGKGALIWLLALVFSILISVVVGILLVILAAIGILPNISNWGSQLNGLIPGVTF